MKKFWISFLAVAAAALLLLSMSAAPLALWSSLQDLEATNSSTSRSVRNARKPIDQESTSACPPMYPANHGLRSTGRKALVMYTFTSHPDELERQVEIDNFLFFRMHGMMPPDTPTALFSAVDYVIAKSNWDRNTSAGLHGVVQCALNHNVRVVEAPDGPCDLCAQARVIQALGGVDVVAQKYEFVMLMNSGIRGPFFTEPHASPNALPPVTWLDYFALGGESMYTGMVMTSTSGIANHRPFLTSFAFGFPTSALASMYPVLVAGCAEMTKKYPDDWDSFLTSYDADLHTADNSTEVDAVLSHILKNPDVLRSVPRGHRDAAARQLDEKIAASVELHLNRTAKIHAKLNTPRLLAPTWPGRKMVCVYRAETQLMKQVLGTKLPPEASRKNGGAVPLHRPNLTDSEVALLSPLLSGYRHEGHFFARSLQHEQTILNMGHGLLLNEHPPGGPCVTVFVRYGGVSWREKHYTPAFTSSIQTLTLAQGPRHNAPSGVNLAQVLRCPTRSDVEPLRL